MRRIDLKEEQPLSLPSPYPAKSKSMKVLIFDCDPSVRCTLLKFLNGRGYEVREVETAQDAIGVATRFLPNIVIFDPTLPDRVSEELVRTFTSPEIGALVVIMTARVEHGAVEHGAVSAMKNGVDHYFPKPLDFKHVEVVLEKLAEKVKLTEENEYFRRISGTRESEGMILGNSPQIIKVQRLATLLARNASTPVLILGESGTGKEVVAKSIHLLSGVKGQMIEVNCASLSETLLESELFGHEKGAFTDAKDTKKGLFEIADGGTIFFDELAEMPLPIQAKILKVLDSKKFRRVGGIVDITSSARFMAATNKDIGSMVKKGLFREDLFYRISVLPINVPPLKERGKDITILSQIFAGRIGERMGKGQPILAAEALDYLQAYCWPGNVRELRNVIERALILSNNNEIHPNHLPAEIRRTPPAAEGDVSPGFAELRSLSQVKDDYIDYVLKMTGNNHSRTAAILGISRSTLLAGLKRKP